MKARTKSRKLNKAWLHDHMNDPYVKLALKEGYRARAAYKLKEIDETLGALLFILLIATPITLVLAGLGGVDEHRTPGGARAVGPPGQPALDGARQTFQACLDPQQRRVAVQHHDDVGALARRGQSAFEQRRRRLQAEQVDGPAGHRLRQRHAPDEVRASGGASHATP